MKVTVVDYGAGNLGSVVKALWRAGADPEVASDAEIVRKAERVVLPGVGAAGAAVARLRQLHLDSALDEVRNAGKPFLGICVGMQVLADTLLEFGEHRGLGWMRGTVSCLPADPGHKVYVPHMGWSEIEVVPDAPSPMLGQSLRERYFYFCHSFVLTGDAGVAVARSTHGVTFTSAVQFDAVFACQFHPEKSQSAGQKLLHRFLQWHP